MFCAIFFFILGLTLAQDTDCDNVQNVGENESYFITKFYSSGQRYRYIATCPDGYRCKLECSLNMPRSTKCSVDRFLVSKIGDPALSGPEAYCGRRTLSLLSTGRTISLGLISSSSSAGGSFRCQVTAKSAPKPPSLACRCGERKQVPKLFVYAAYGNITSPKRIVGGEEMSSNQYTMMAGIIDKTQDTIHCGGVIISSRYVLTAAHCVESSNTTDLSVFVGHHNINSNKGKRYEIMRFNIHEKYNREIYDYDVALIEVERKIVFSENILPACLPFKYADTDLTGKTVTILGWGDIGPGGMLSPVLRQVDVNVIDVQRCRASEGNVTDRQMCTYSPGKDACQHDSGGPLLLTDADTGLLFSVGVVSYSNTWCGTDRPAINTRLTALLPWIIENVNDSFCRK